MKRTATSTWRGTGKEGSGSLTTQSGVFNEQPYSFQTRFKNEDGKEGTNPEELIAAAHAGCFNMALGVQLGEKNYDPDELKTEAVVYLEKVDDGFEITAIKLKLEAKIKGISEDDFKVLAEGAKKGCPISKALSAVDIQLDAKLLS